MFKLFSKSGKSKADFSILKTDMHSHLLPGIDDGSPDMETSLQLIKGMMELGYNKFITTPHVLWEMYPNTRDSILKKQDELRGMLKANGIDVSVSAAAEYFLDNHVEELLKKKEPLLTISGNMVLTEFSLAFPQQGIKEIYFEMQMQGYQPVVAHPERYVYLERNKGFYDELKEIGCLFQLNTLSLAGHYGKTVQELAQYLVKKGYYNLIGTDLHNSRHLSLLVNTSLSEQVKRLVGSVTILNEGL